MYEYKNIVNTYFHPGQTAKHDVIFAVKTNSYNIRSKHHLSKVTVRCYTPRSKGHITKSSSLFNINGTRAESRRDSRKPQKQTSTRLTTADSFICLNAIRFCVKYYLYFSVSVPSIPPPLCAGPGPVDTLVLLSALRLRG